MEMSVGAALRFLLVRTHGADLRGIVEVEISDANYQD
jgi:hypothetical protein